MRPRGSRRKHERRPVIDMAGVISRSGGPVIVRGPAGGSVRRSRGSGVGIVVLLALLGAAYWAVGTYRHALVTTFPETYAVLKAIGFEVEEPAGHGLRAEVLKWDRYRDETNQAYLLINGVVANTRGERVAIPRLRLVISSSRRADIVVVHDPPQSTLGPRERTRFEVRHRTGVALFDVRVRVGFEKK